MAEWDSLIDSGRAPYSLQYVFKFSNANQWAEYTPELQHEPNWNDKSASELALEITISIVNLSVEKQLALSRLDRGFGPNMDRINNPEPVLEPNCAQVPYDNNEYSTFYYYSIKNKQNKQINSFKTKLYLIQLKSEQKNCCLMQCSCT